MGEVLRHTRRNSALVVDPTISVSSLNRSVKLRRKRSSFPARSIHILGYSRIDQEAACHSRSQVVEKEPVGIRSPEACATVSICC